MESHAQSVEDNLIDSLSFKLKPGASYVTDRKSVSFFPQGGNDYQPNGVKVIKISLNGDSWLDGSTCKLFFDVTNNSSGSDKIHPIVANGWGLFKRLRIFCGGQIIEDIDNYGRLHQMFHLMKPSEKRGNALIEGFGDWNDAGNDLDVQQTCTICSALSCQVLLYNGPTTVPMGMSTTVLRQLSVCNIKMKAVHM